MLLKQGVWYNPHKYIRKLMPEIDKVFIEWNTYSDGKDGIECIVTSCGDGQHSVDSMHHLAESKAIDIRPPITCSSSIKREIRRVLNDFEIRFGVKYILLDEGDHWHIQVKE